MTEPIRVLLVDDEPKIRASWEKLLAQAPDFECAGTLANTDRAAEVARERDARVILLDFIIPGYDTVQALQQIVCDCPECRVIVYSAYMDDETTRRVLDAGAWGFLDKMTPVNMILEAIRLVASGQVVMPMAPLIETAPPAPAAPSVRGSRRNGA